MKFTIFPFLILASIAQAKPKAADCEAQLLLNNALVESQHGRLEPHDTISFYLKNRTVEVSLSHMEAAIDLGVKENGVFKGGMLSATYIDRFYFNANQILNSGELVKVVCKTATGPKRL